MTRVCKKIFTILRQLNPTPRYLNSISQPRGTACETVPTFQLIAKRTDVADEHRAWSAWLGSGLLLGTTQVRAFMPAHGIN